MRMIRVIRLRRAGQAMIRVWYENDHKAHTLQKGDHDEVLAIAATLARENGLSRSDCSDEWTRRG